jgi:hypothetical protein
MTKRRRTPTRSKPRQSRLKQLPAVDHIASESGLPEIPNQVLGLTPEMPGFRRRKEVDGVPLPTDLDASIEVYSRKLHANAKRRATTTPWTFMPEEWSQEERAKWRPMSDDLDWEMLAASYAEAMRQGFYLALLRYSEHLKAVAEATAILDAVRENGEMLASEGRARKKEKDDERAAIVRDLWKKVRSSFPQGRSGNAPAINAILERFTSQTHSIISARTVRNILQKSGIDLPK